MSTEAIQLKVIAGSSRNLVKQLDDNMFKVWTTAVPEKGKANQRVIALLADFLDIPKSEIHLVKGAGATNKLVIIGDDNE